MNHDTAKLEQVNASVQAPVPVRFAKGDPEDPAEGWSRLKRYRGACSPLSQPARLRKSTSPSRADSFSLALAQLSPSPCSSPTARPSTRR